MNKIDEIKEALAAATPGPWEVFDTGKLHNEYIKGVKNASGIVADIILTEDAHFIAKAPEYITYLLQEIERKDEALNRIVGLEEDISPDNEAWEFIYEFKNATRIAREAL